MMPALMPLHFFDSVLNKLAEGVVCSDWNMNHHPENGDEISSEHKDDQIYFWVPLLSGLSKLTTDSRTAIRKSALEVLFDIFKDHGNLFTHSFWNSVFKSVINPMFHKVHYMLDQFSRSDGSKFFEDDSWNPETTLVAAQSLSDLFIKSFVRLRPQLGNVVENLTCIIVSPHQQYFNTGMTVLLHLMDHIGGKLSEVEWRDALLLLKKATTLSLSVFTRIVEVMYKIEVPNTAEVYSDAERNSDHEFVNDDEEDANMEAASYTVVRMTGHIAVELLIIKAVTKLYDVHHKSLSSENTTIILDILSSIASHASEVNSKTALQQKVERVCSLLEMTSPPIVHFENEAYSNYLKLLNTLLKDNPILSEEAGLETQLVDTSVKILHIYLNCTEHDQKKESHWVLPLGSTKKEELAERTSILLVAMEALAGMESESFRRHLPRFFPLLIKLVCCEHSSGEVQKLLYGIFQSSVGPVILKS